MPDGDDDCETPGCPDDDDNDSIHGDEEDVNNLSLGMYVKGTHVDVLSPFMTIFLLVAALSHEEGALFST